MRINFLGYRDTVSHYYHTRNFLPINDIFKLELAKFMFKFNKGLLPANFNSYFERASSVHHHFTRLSQQNFFLPRNSKSAGFKSLSSLGVRLWHEIPDVVKQKPTINSFINCYKQCLKSDYEK